MPSNPKDSRWRSTPPQQRTRPLAGWTIHRDVIAAVQAKAEEEGIAAAAWAERELAKACGIEPPARPPNDRAPRKKI